MLKVISFPSGNSLPSGSKKNKLPVKIHSLSAGPQKAFIYNTSLCGDCLASGRHSSITYRFPGPGPENARKLYITETVVTYSLVPAMAGI